MPTEDSDGTEYEWLQDTLQASTALLLTCDVIITVLKIFFDRDPWMMLTTVIIVAIMSGPMVIQAAIAIGCLLVPEWVTALLRLRWYVFCGTAVGLVWAYTLVTRLSRLQGSG
jgi:hypothetical protein